MDVGRQRDVGPDTVPVICEEPNGLDIVPVTPLPDCVNVIVTTNDAVSIPKIPSRCISSPRAS